MIDDLLRPEAYAGVQGISPADAATVSLLQTHISLLFFVGDAPHGRVFKVKKPVDMGFLDYTTVDARRHFCHEEVRLNRRLAPEIYLGVRAVVRGTDGRLRIGEERDGEVVDYAVEMTRLPAGRMLSALLERGDIDNKALGAIVELLVRFHGACPTGSGVDEHASPRSIRQQVDETLAHLEPFTGRVLSQNLLASLREWFDRFMADNESLLEKRIRDGRIREGHGDLHSENICLLGDDRIVVYDCIEFTPRFRCRDVACELGFLAMDLDARGYRGFSQYLTHQYAAMTGDSDFHRALPLYKVYLALVRAKVAALKSAGAEVDEAESAEAVLTASRYAQLAGTYLIEPALIITCGLPGSGKSWAAGAVARPFEAMVLRSDVIRKQLAGIEPQQDASQSMPEIYSPSYTKRTYTAMLNHAREALAASRTVVADATFASESLRRPFIELAEQNAVPWVILLTHAPDEEIRRRMSLRAADASEVSDADWAVYERARQDWQSPTEVDPSRVVHIGPDTTPEQVAARAINALLAAER